MIYAKKNCYYKIWLHRDRTFLFMLIFSFTSLKLSNCRRTNLYPVKSDWSCRYCILSSLINIENERIIEMDQLVKPTPIQQQPTVMSQTKTMILQSTGNEFHYVSPPHLLTDVKGNTVHRRWIHSIEWNEPFSIGSFVFVFSYHNNFKHVFSLGRLQPRQQQRQSSKMKPNTLWIWTRYLRQHLRSLRSQIQTKFSTINHLCFQVDHPYHQTILRHRKYMDVYVTRTMCCTSPSNR